MSGPPPLPQPTRQVPGWVGIVVGVAILLLMIVGGGYGTYAWMEQEKSDGTQAPKRGVRYATEADEELSVGADGEFRYRNKRTGEVRVVWVEGDDAPEPTWLKLPAGAERLSGSGVHSMGRRDASFEYRVGMPPPSLQEFFLKQLRGLGFTVRHSKVNAFHPYVHGEDATREAFVNVSLEDGGVRLKLRITEPSSRK